MNQRNKNHIKILIVDDRKEDLHLIKLYLSSQKNIHVKQFVLPEEAFNWAKSNPFDVAIVDYSMPGLSGPQLIKDLKNLRPESIYLLMTAYADLEKTIEAIRQGAFDFLIKPIEREIFNQAIERAINHVQFKRNANLKEAARGKQSQSGSLVGESSIIDEIRNKIKLYANSDLPIFITGETGTGKEVVARSIHRESSRNQSKFVAVNCSAFVETLLESELFGHEKGAFTGADRQRIGKLEFAEDGVIFLDEISEIPTTMQVKLLRVLQEKEFERVGGNKSVNLKARIISATNRDVQSESHKNPFRKDLFYRLNILPLHIPPLRERREDIEILANHFLRKCSKTTGKQNQSFHKEVIDIFSNYDWPGNVRQLENAVSYATVHCEDVVIRVDHLPKDIAQGLSTGIWNSQNHIPIQEEGEDGKTAIENEEKEKIVNSLKKNRWNKSKTANELGMSRSQLIYRIKKYSIH